MTNSLKLDSRTAIHCIDSIFAEFLIESSFFNSRVPSFLFMYKYDICVDVLYIKNVLSDGSVPDEKSYHHQYK